MPGISVPRIAIPFKGKGGINYAAYWATLISATVETAAPTHVVLTFAAANATVTADDFAVTGFTVASGSWTDAVFTLVLSRAVTFLDLALTITFVKTGESSTVTNNVAVSNLLAYYDHIQGEDAAVLYDKSGNDKHGTLASAPNNPTWTSTGNEFSSDVKTYINIPDLMSSAGAITAIISRKTQAVNASYRFLLQAETVNFSIIDSYDAIKDRIVAIFYLDSYVQCITIRNNQWATIGVVIDSPNVVVYINGVKCFVTTVTKNTYFKSNHLGVNNTTYKYEGVVGCTALFNVALDDLAIFQLTNSINSKITQRGVNTLPNNITNQVICDGDSLTNGSKSTELNDYPNKLMYINNSVSAVNLGVDSQRIDAMLANTGTKIDPLYMNTGVLKSIVVCWGGTNDLASFGRSDTDVYNDIVSYCSGRQVVGFKVIVLTIMPSTQYSAGEEVYRQSVNTSIRTNWATFADALVDVAADARLDDFNDATYFDADKIHLTDEGYAVVASLVNDAIEALV